MDIVSMVSELALILNEEKQIRGQLTRLRNRRATLETQISKALRDSDDPGVKYQGLQIALEEKEVRHRKKKTEQIDGAKNVLKTNGVANADRVLESVINALRGDKTLEQKLTVKKIK